MVEIEDILEEYEKADKNKRLHMYLQFPDLRAIFSEKERGIIYQELDFHFARRRDKRDNCCSLYHTIKRKASRGFWGRLLSGNAFGEIP